MTEHADTTELTISGSGHITPIDPRMMREPAGSLLLARASAIRNAQQAGLRQVAISLVPTPSPALEQFVDRELVPRSREFVCDRQVISESRTDPSDQGATYYIELRIVFDMQAVKSALRPFKESL